MRTIDGHFTVINEPGSARALAADLLHMFESVRAPEHIIITEELITQAASRAQTVLSTSLAQSVKRIEAEIEAIPVSDGAVTHAHIDKAQAAVLEATNRAEKTSSSKNWRKLDAAQKKLSKELEKSGFSIYTDYVDFLNSRGAGGQRRHELTVALEDLLVKKKQAETKERSLSSLTPAQIITVLADVLSRCPHTPVGPLPIVIDDALRNVDVSTKLRAMEVLKAHSTHYATWYVTDDPVVLSWAGFSELYANERNRSASKLFDIDQEIAS